MKTRDHRRLILAGLAGAGLWWYNHTPEPTLLSFRIGQTFEEVVASSTYPVMERSNLPSDDSTQFGVTWVTEPAAIIRFTDSVHGFTLPPTKFASLGFHHNVATTLSTSPMLDKLPFRKAVSLLENLQNQFKAGGWEPYDVHESKWFDLTPEGKKQLHAAMFKAPFLRQETLRVPGKYAMTFRFQCAEGCWTREPPYLFLIDIGLSDDVHDSKREDSQQSHSGRQAAKRLALPDAP